MANLAVVPSQGEASQEVGGASPANPDVTIDQNNGTASTNGTVTTAKASVNNLSGAMLVSGLLIWSVLL